MAPELKEELKKSGTNDNQNTPSQEEIIKKQQDDLEKSQKERDEALQKAADIQFASDFNATASIYPHAKDFEKEIREKTKLGLSVTDATFLVLKNADKLQSKDEIAAAENKGEGLGGSSVSVRTSGEDKDKKPSTLAEAEKAFRDAEARGDIKLGE